MSNRPFNRSTFLSDLRADRITPKPIREERLRTMAGLRGTPALALSAWRGLSGRRYVVGVHGLTVEAAEESLPAVLVAVRRGGSGLAVLLDLYSGEAETSDVREWVARAAEQGATELHIHRLAEGADERIAIVADLTAPVSEAA